MSVDDGSGFPAPRHDHAACVREAVEAAEALCRDHGRRLTPLRRRVLELIWNSHRPVGAYDILDRLREERDGPVAPPTIYRSLEFLSEAGLVHRIDSLNAFIGCMHAGATHRAYFLICDSCGTAAELDDDRLGRALGAAADRAGFRTRQETVELRGLCPACDG